MGFVLSKFRKEKSTTTVLEELQVRIQELEKNVINTQERKRRFVTNFVGFTIGVYIVGFALWYFFYFPPTMQERIMYLVPLLLFPILIVFLRQMFTWYFQRKLNKNGDKLKELKEKKSKILQQVMDKETYKVAVNLLERFGDKQQNRLLGISSSVRPAVSSSTTPNRSTTSSNLQRTPQTLTPYTSVYRNMNNNLNSSVITTQSQVSTVTASTPQVRVIQELRRRTPFPIVDESSRSALDRIVDFIVGDSPQNRFGMICKECHKHNGMLPMEDYEYTTFHCAFCGTLNPARKERPKAPRLSLEAHQKETAQSPQLRNESSDSDSSDDEDDDYANTPSTRRALDDDLPMTDTEADGDAKVNTNSNDDENGLGATNATKVEEIEAKAPAASETESM